MASDAPTALMLSSAQHQHAVNNLLQQHVANMKAGRVQQCGLSAEQALLNKSSNVTTAQSTPDLMSLLMMQQMQQFPTQAADAQLPTRQSSGSVSLSKAAGVNVGLGSISAPQLMLDAQLSSPVPGAAVSTTSSITNAASSGNSNAHRSQVATDSSAHDYLMGRMSGSSNGSCGIAVGFSPSSNPTPVQDNNSGLGLPGPNKGSSGACFQVPRLDRVSELGNGGPQDNQPHILNTAVSASAPANGQASENVTSSSTSSPQPAAAAPGFPTTLTVSGTTDIAQASSLVNLALSQPSVKSFIVVAPLGAPTNTGSMAAVCAALRVATTARRMHQAAGAHDSDLAILPMFNTPIMYSSPGQQSSIDLHVYQVKGTCRVARGSVPSLRVDPTGNAQALAQQLAQAFLGGQHSAVEVVFGSASARLALLTLAQAQLCLARGRQQRQDVLLLPVSDQSNAFSVLMVHANAMTVQQAESEDLQAQAALAEVQAMKRLLDGANGNTNGSASNMMPGSTNSLVSHPSGALSNNYGSSAALSTLTSLHSSPLQPPPGIMMPPAGSQADLAALLQPFSQMDLGAMNGAGSYDQAANLNPLLNLSRVGSMHTGMAAGTDPNSSMAALAYQAALASSFGTSPGSMMPTAFGGLGMGGILDAAGAGAAAAMASQAAAAAAAAVAQQQANAANKARARKADWVIVTEDTAIKNAAGAIAKVLGRMAPQGLCCPVYMERKTSKFTSVVSVAVKAIAVARGYVSNEGGGHEVGFQPYVRGDACACAYGATRPPGAPALSTSATSTLETLTQLARGDTLSTQLLSLTGNNDLASQLLQQSTSSHSMGGLSPRVSGGNNSMFSNSSNPLSALTNNDLAQLGSLLGTSPLLNNTPPVNNQVSVWTQMLKELGMNDVNGGSDGSSACDDDGGPSWSELEQVELAFDVYKVHLQQEIPDAGNLPVKVTAHSRPGVVANIISKLVVERGAAVLITAGGRAMHVAMLAIVTARQRLQSQGADILLLPKFVTVDTTSTLGWESVFLRFSIVKWSPATVALGAANDLTNKLSLLGRTSL